MSLPGKMSSTKSTKGSGSLCPLMFTLHKLAGRWTLAILRELMGQSVRFNELKRRLPQISGRSLARLLQKLGKEGLVRRTVTSAEPRTITYSLARPDPVLRELIEVATAWGKENFLRCSAEQRRSLVQSLSFDPRVAISPLIVESWKRSRQAGVDPAPDRRALHQVTRHDQRWRLVRNGPLLDVAEPVLEAASRAVKSISHGLFYLVDKDGVVLYSTGDGAIMEAWGLALGYDWSEKTMGTNATGTALVAKRPVAVIGPEHYSFPFHDMACVGAPIRSPEGNVIAAIGLCTQIADAKPEQLAAILKLASEIERKLAATSRRRGKGD